MPKDGKLIQRKAGAGHTLAFAGDVYTFLATGEETDNKYALIDSTVFPGGGPPPHKHSREVESFYILQGEITFQVAEEVVKASAGDFLQVPIGVVHRFQNETENVGRMLILLAPAGLEKLFEAIGHPVADPSTPPPPSTHQDVGRLRLLAPEYGIELVLPE